jgi:uncharacterized repeat protein (TIGR01451 family)
MIRRLTLLLTLALAAPLGVRPAAARQAPGPMPAPATAPAADGDDAVPATEPEAEPLAEGSAPLADPFGGLDPAPAADAPARPGDGLAAPGDDARADLDAPASQPQGRPTAGNPAPRAGSAGSGVGAGPADAAPAPLGDDAVEPPARPAPDASPYPPYDPAVTPAQVPGADEGANLRPAIEPAGGVAVPDDAPQGESYVPKAESLRAGPNSVGLTAEVTAPSVVNLNLESELTLNVRNTGPADATNVLVRYPKPPNVEILSSDPPANAPAGDFWSWSIRSLPSGQQKVIKLKVRYTREEPVDHVATVTLQAAAKARTQVRKPDLRVEVRTDKPKVLKGDRVVFDITVSNFGNYAARDVVLRATLGPGLAHVGGRSLELALKDEPLLIESLKPGQVAGPLKLEVEARDMGDQACEVVASSPDLPTEVVAAPCKVEVVAPRLSVDLDGPAVRFPGTVGRYTLTVSNDGTDTAHNVMVAIKVPVGGKPVEAVPEKFHWEASRRTIYWQIKDLPPGEPRPFTVDVRMDDVGSLAVVGGARADNVEAVKKPLTTQIQGIARLEGTVNEPRGVLDVGEETEYQVRLTNVGTRDAENVLVKVRLSPGLKAVAVIGADGKESPAPAPAPDGSIPLPALERLPFGDQAVLSIRARADQAGRATCQAEIQHKDIADAPITIGVVTHISEPASTRR